LEPRRVLTSNQGRNRGDDQMTPAATLAQNRIGLPPDRILFMSSRISVTPSGCWVWTGTLNHHNYGIVRIGEKRLRVHRVMWALKNGTPAPGVKLLHSCDNPPCCNPSHVFPGTQADNMRDMQAKGRKPIGSKCPWSILNDATVVEIRRRKLAGASARALAVEFAVSESAVYKIAQGTRWKHSHSGFSPAIREEIERLIAG
jgi:hypothetical protein